MLVLLVVAMKESTHERDARKAILQSNAPLQVCKSYAGFYIGTKNVSLRQAVTLLGGFLGWSYQTIKASR